MDPQLRKFLESRMEQYFYLVPEHMHGGFKRYVFDRCQPGGFLTAVLENNLKEAAARADDKNKAALANIAAFCIEALPMACWGSPQKVAKWLSPEEIEEDCAYDKDDPKHPKYKENAIARYEAEKDDEI